jgi:hypothetical protein
MTLLIMHRPKRERVRHAGAAHTALAVILMATVVVAAGACGGSSSAKSATAQASGQAVQTMATVQRGDLVATLTGKLTLSVAGSTATAATTFTGDGASQVAVGQTVKVVFMGQVGGAGQAGGAGQSSPQASARPSAAPSAPGGVQGSPPSAGAPGLSRGGLVGKSATGTISAVQHSSDGSATVRIAIDKLPSGVTTTSVGMATIDAGVLARNVLIVPTAAIKGSGAGTTVQVVVGGQTTPRKVVVGKQTQTESEIVSGLSAGDNVVYEHTMRGGFGRAGGAQPPGQARPAQSGSQSTGVGGGT